jgi:Na+-transporting methylmalonyl-CoA/oxaloacetate decarboxylase gamma subunit
MPFGLSAVAVKAIGIGLLVLALLAGFAWFVHSEREVGAQKVRDEVAAATAAQKVADDAETQRRVTAQQAVSHDAQLQADAARADAARADAARNAMRVQLAGFVATNRRAANSTAAAGSSPSDDPIGVLAEVLGTVDDAAGRYAAEADANWIGWSACIKSYNALTSDK